MTQIEAARQGLVTPEMHYVAEREDLYAELIRAEVARGRMVIPVESGDFAQDLLVLTKRADGQLDRRRVAPVRFVPMTGEIKK